MKPPALSPAPMSKGKRILVAMSGGVDSSVAALVLKKQGYSIAGAYMKNWINEDEIIGECPWEQDITDARAVCDSLGIEFTVVNLMKEYKELVVEYLLDGYTRGLTPNPDVMCNREMKFGVFRAWAKAQGFAEVATGHYARKVPSSTLPGAWDLIEGADKNKDQSYFLALLRQEQLADACFPIGDLQKPELRALAAEAGLSTAGKKDSQGICFIGQVRMQDFLGAYVSDKPGPIFRAGDGKALGTHRGLHYYTLGQRKGIGIPSNTDNQAYVVVGKRAADNALLVAFDGPEAPGLWCEQAQVHGLSWTGEPLRNPCRIEGRVRYRDPRVGLQFEPLDNNSALVRFEKPQRALAAGQILALYDGERLLGGGVYL